MKKFLSVFLAFLMTVIVLPVNAFAEEVVYFSISDDGAYVYSDTKQIPLAYVEIPISEIKEIDLKNTDLENMQQTITKMGKTILLFFIFISTHMKNIIMKGQILLWKMQKGLPEVYFSNGSGVMIATSTTM